MDKDVQLLMDHCMEYRDEVLKIKKNCDVLNEPYPDLFIPSPIFKFLGLNCIFHKYEEVHTGYIHNHRNGRLIKASIPTD